MECSDSTTDEVIGACAVDEVELAISELDTK